MLARTTPIAVLSLLASLLAPAAQAQSYTSSQIVSAVSQAVSNLPHCAQLCVAKIPGFGAGSVTIEEIAAMCADRTANINILTTCVQSTCPAGDQSAVAPLVQAIPAGCAMILADNLGSASTAKPSGSAATVAGGQGNLAQSGAAEGLGKTMGGVFAAVGVVLAVML
ncbi:hypothetical protein HK101_008418 [Irineochytrium annulatum]|nr:hypothetical protein HK101_008418 [Irineochytrium annulatum]